MPMQPSLEIQPCPKVLVKLGPPSKDDLLSALGARVSRSMLEEIAANDYGEEVPAHLAGIEAQIAPNAPLGKLDWCPREVLELQVWSEPDDDPDVMREHVKRMLACTILLRNAGCAVSESPCQDFFLEVSANTVAQLIRSIMADTPIELSRTAGLGLLLWLYESQPFAPLQPFVAFGALILGASLAFGNATDSDVQTAYQWMNDVETRCRSVLSSGAQSERWLVGLNPYVDGNDGRMRWISAAETGFSHLNRRSDELKLPLQSMLEALSA